MDERVATAITHWAPRFFSNGVFPTDLDAITASLERWEDWCAAWSGVAGVHEGLGREALAVGRSRSAAAHLTSASVLFHFAKFVFVNDLDQMRAAHSSAVRCLNDALQHLEPPGARHEIPFEGTSLAGVLRIPHARGPAPAVVLIAGLDSAKEEFRATEELFLERGIATFSVDGPGQGEAEYDLAIRADWEVPGAAIVDYLTAQPAIDADRIGLWGVSLGGYYAPRVAAHVPVRACIALAGPYDFGAIWDDLPVLTRETFRVRARTSNDQEARAHASTLSLDGHAARIRSPLLVVMGKRDRLIPWQHAQRLADEAGGTVDLLLLEDGNHGCANVPYKHRYRSADWMAERLTR